MSLITSDFEIITRDVDERAAELEMEANGTPASKVSEGLALLKARAVHDALPEEDKSGVVVIGADTSVILDDVIFGKPKDHDEAVDMLTKLSGRSHAVVTGVALITSGGETSFSERSDVVFNDYDDYQKALIARYCDSSEPYDKAGAYGIQGGGALLVKGIEGDFFNVVGLPVSRLAREIESVII